MIKPCAECRRSKKIAAKGLCWRCYNLQRTEKCVHCGGVKPIAARTEDGGAVCLNCYHQRHTEECVYCGEVKPINARTEDGGAVCWSCHTEKCVHCGKTRQIQARTEDGGAVCQVCRLKVTGRYGICPSCGKGPRATSYISPLTGKYVCQKCYKTHKEEVAAQPAPT